MKHPINLEKVKAFCNPFSKGRKGGEALLFVLAVLEFAGALHSLYGFLPPWLLIVGSVLLAVVLPVLLYLGMLLLFGTKRLIRALYIADIAGLLVFLFGATQGGQIVFNIVYAVLFVSAVDLLGRSFYAFVIEKKRKRSLVITAGVSLSVLLLAVFFLIPSGFANGNVERYEAMQEKGSSAPSGFADSLHSGDVEVMSTTYGMGEGYYMQSETYDLSPFEKRGFINRILMKLQFDHDVDETPLSGKIWYPKDLMNCPVLFIVHGNHDISEDSYLGYEYIGEYLARFGYVVVSVDENYCNSLSNENDARAILLLENVRKVLEWNKDPDNILYKRIDPEQISLAGHSRGGECVSIAALFNGYTRYPENGNIRFDYNFPIRSLIAIAPTTDQYMPASQYVDLADIPYLLIHGSNDHDVSRVMGEKTYDHMHYTQGGNGFCSVLYVIGANHGQFNTRWGRYDYPFPENRMLDVRNLITAEDQREILCTFLKTYLDVTLKGDETYKSLFYEIGDYLRALPPAAYQQMYRDNTFACMFDFDVPSELGKAGNERLSVLGVKEWTYKRRGTSSHEAGENFALAFRWGEDTDKKKKDDVKEDAAENSQKGMPSVSIACSLDLTDTLFSFNLADMREKDKVEKAGPLSYKVIFTDANGVSAMADRPVTVFPSVSVQLYKADVLLHQYEYKHQFTTVRVPFSVCVAEEGFDPANVRSVKIEFADEKGDIEIDDIGSAKE